MAEEKSAIDQSATLAKEVLTSDDTTATISSDLGYSDMDDDLSRHILDSHTPFLFLVDVNTGDGLLCEYRKDVKGITAVTPGNYRQMHLAAADVKLLRKSTGIVPDYLNLPRDMTQRPEGIMSNLATLTMLKLVNLFDEVNATSQGEQKNMLARFIKDRTGKAVQVNTTAEERRQVQQATPAPTTIVQQFSAEEDVFRRLFARTQEKKQTFPAYDIGMLKEDTFLYTWDNRYSYVPALLGTKGTAFKKGTVIFRFHKDDTYSMIVVLDMRKDIFADDSYAVKDSMFVQDKVYADHLIRVEDNYSYAAKDQDITYITDIEEPKTRFTLISRLFEGNKVTRGIKEWESLLKYADDIQDKLTAEEKEKEAAMKKEKEEKEQLRVEFETKLEEEAYKFTQLLGRMRKRDSQTEAAYVKYGKMGETITWNDGTSGSIKKGARILIVEKTVVPDFEEVDRYAAMPETVKVGERTWFGVFFLDRRRSIVSDKFAANYSNLTIPFAEGCSGPTVSPSSLPSEEGLISKIFGVLSAMNTDEEDMPDDNPAKRPQIETLEQLKINMFAKGIMVAKDNALKPKEVLALNPAAFKDYVSVMNAKELKIYGGGENEYFGCYMNGIDFANFVLDAEINDKSKAAAKKQAQEDFEKDRQPGGKVYEARQGEAEKQQANTAKFNKLRDKFKETVGNYYKSAVPFTNSSDVTRGFPRIATVTANDTKIYTKENSRNNFGGASQTTLKKRTRLLILRPVPGSTRWNRITSGDRCFAKIIDQRKNWNDGTIDNSFSEFKNGIFVVNCSDVEMSEDDRADSTEGLYDFFALWADKVKWLIDLPFEEFPIEAFGQASATGSESAEVAYNYWQTTLKKWEVKENPKDPLITWGNSLRAIIQKQKREAAEEKKEEDPTEESGKDSGEDSGANEEVAADVTGTTTTTVSPDEEETYKFQPLIGDPGTTYNYKGEMVNLLNDGQNIIVKRKGDLPDVKLSYEEAAKPPLYFWGENDDGEGWDSWDGDTELLRLSVPEEQSFDTFTIE